MNPLTACRNPAQEAADRAPDGMSPRVLEPSPPAVIDGDFFADDPVALADGDPETTLRPFTAGTQPARPTWQAAGADDTELASFAADRWLGPWHRLGAVPTNYVAQREAFHRLAYSVVAAARHAENGKFGLRFTAGGFGTPFFGEDRQVRVVGNTLVDQVGDTVRTMQPGSIKAAAEFIGVEPSTVAAEGDSPPLGDPSGPLDLDPATGDFLGAWFGFATSVLEELRAAAPESAQPGRTQLWPGHFDPAVELGDESAGHRATFGASPGDAGSAEPYLYVGPWAGTTDDPFWNASAFPGALLPFDQLLTASEQRQTAIDFFRRAIELLTNR